MSTDPASNLDAVLGVALGSRPTPIPDVPSLSALNIDPEVAAREYRERALAPQRGVLPAAELALLEERLAGACTMEVAAFDEFTLLLTEQGVPAQLDHILFDTAPMGHTLRLLELPAAWTGFLETSTAEASCIGPLSALKAQRDRFAATVAALADAAQTLLVLVARPERVALLEAARTSGELGALGMRSQFLLVNGVFRATDASDPLAVRLEERGQQALQAMPPVLEDLPRAEVPMHGFNLVGLAALRGFFRPDPPGEVDPMPPDLPPLGGLGGLVDEIARASRGLVMVMGKGGVGKTTVAAAIAVALAGRGHPVHLTTTDPAAHLADGLGSEVPGLAVSRIDAEAEYRRYCEDVLERNRSSLDPAKLALLEEELRSPCYEELAVFLAFARLVKGSAREFVVMDTAPTGHTLLLLDTTGAYHRETMKRMAGVPGRVKTPLMQIQDPESTRVVLVTTPEPTPVLEAEALQDDLRRAGIEPFAWVVNGSLAAAKPRDPVLRQRARAEREPILRSRGSPAGSPRPDAGRGAGGAGPSRGPGEGMKPAVRRPPPAARACRRS